MKNVIMIGVMMGVLNTMCVSKTTLLIDQSRSPQTGAYLLTSVQASITELKRDVAPWLTVSDIEKGKGSPTIMKQAAKLTHWVAWDDPLSRYLWVWQHEYFGHVFRARELGYGGLKARSYAPLPYALFSSKESSSLATYRTEPESLSLFEKTTVHIAGIDASFEMHQQIFYEWFVDEEIDFSSLGLAFNTYFDFIRYNLKTKEWMLDNTSYKDWDTIKFLEYVNERYGYSNPKTYKMTVSDLRKAAIVNLLSPIQLLQSHWFGTNLTELIPINTSFFNYKELTFFPNISARFSPFGLYWKGECWLKKNGNVSHVFVDVSGGHFTSFWGVGIDMYERFRINNARVGLKAQLWNQPLMNGSDPYDLRLGGLVKLRIKTRLSDRVDVMANIGAKTHGYTPSYPLKQGAFIQLGITMR